MRSNTLHTKRFITWLTIGVMFMPLILRAVVDGHFPSISSTAGSAGEPFYLLMHGAGAMMFTLVYSRTGRALDIICGGGMLLIAAFSMHIYPMWHNMFTGLTFAAALANIVSTTSFKIRSWWFIDLTCVLLAVLFFLATYTSEDGYGISFYYGELVAMSMIGTNMLIRNARGRI